MSGDEIQVVLVDDHPSVRRGLEMILPRLGLRVIGTASTAEEGERMARARKPDVAVVDIDLAGASGTDVAREMLDEDPDIKIVLYTGHAEPDVLADAVHSGVAGVVLKGAPLEDLVAAIRSAAAGGHFLDPQVSRMLADRAEGGRGCISSREAEILTMFAEGLTTDDIAERLFLSPMTVATHARNAVRKLGARGRLHAVILALQAGEIDLPGPPADSVRGPAAGVGALSRDVTR